MAAGGQNTKNCNKCLRRKDQKLFTPKGFAKGLMCMKCSLDDYRAKLAPWRGTYWWCGMFLPEGGGHYPLSMFDISSVRYLDYGVNEIELGRLPREIHGFVLSKSGKLFLHKLAWKEGKVFDLVDFDNYDFFRNRRIKKNIAFYHPGNHTIFVYCCDEEDTLGG